MKKHIPLLLVCLGLSSQAFALFCPGNFQLIQNGDSMDTVTQRCGKPDKILKLSAATPTGPEEWIYALSVANQGSLRMSVMLADNRIVNIVVNGTGLTSTTVCGTSISSGDTADTLKAACGQPLMINHGAGNAAPADSQQQNAGNEEWTYNTSPPVTLVFQNSKLTGKK